MSSSRHVFIAWELGGGLGHITRITSLARGFLQQGCTVSLALKDLSKSFSFVSSLPVRVFQAPVWTRRLRDAGDPVCFSDILIQRGYGTFDGLWSYVASWQALLKITRPDLILFDYAPTAMLAARGDQVPNLTLGHGFSEIPPGEPDLCLRPWLRGAVERTRAREALLVKVVNRVMEQMRKPPIERLSDIYTQADRCFPIIVPEADLFQNRPDATYLPPMKEAGGMAPAEWPAGEGPKVFAYLKPSSPQCLPTLESLAQLPCTGLVVCGGLDQSEIDRLQRPGLSIYPTARDITRALPEADLVICHAGKNTLSDSLFAGIPLLMLPEQLEQHLGAQKVEQAGAGLVLGSASSGVDNKDALQRLLTESRFREAAQAIAARNAPLLELDPVETVVQKGMTLMDQAAERELS